MTPPATQPAELEMMEEFPHWEMGPAFSAVAPAAPESPSDEIGPLGPPRLTRSLTPVYPTPPPAGAEPIPCADAREAELFLRFSTPSTRIWVNPSIGTSKGTKDAVAVRARVALYAHSKTVADFFRLHPGGSTPHGPLAEAEFVQAIRRGDILYFPTGIVASPSEDVTVYPTEAPTPDLRRGARPPTPPKHKVRVVSKSCWDFIQGRCQRGDTCKWAHDQPPKEAVAPLAPFLQAPKPLVAGAPTPPRSRASTSLIAGVARGRGRTPRGRRRLPRAWGPTRGAPCHPRHPRRPLLRGREYCPSQLVGRILSLSSYRGARTRHRRASISPCR